MTGEPGRSMTTVVPQSGHPFTSTMLATNERTNIRLHSREGGFTAPAGATVVNTAGVGTNLTFQMGQGNLMF
jgi:hypothetical protein